jgi:hypothetical protein
VKPVVRLVLGIQDQHVVLRVDFLVKEPLGPLLWRIERNRLRVQDVSL